MGKWFTYKIVTIGSNHINNIYEVTTPGKGGGGGGVVGIGEASGEGDVAGGEGGVAAREGGGTA